MHMSGLPSICPVVGCGRSIPNRKRYSEHMAWHRGETVCSLCGRRFSSKSNLRIHQSTLHGLHSLTRLLSGGSAGRPEAPFACRLCDKVFRDASNLSHHTAVHRGETTCRRCFAVLATKRNLRAHLANCLGPNLTPRRNSARAAEVRGSAPAPHGPRPVSSERSAHWEGPSGTAQGGGPAQGAPPAEGTEPTLWFQ
ncbi:Zinc finger protein 2 [Amphibalanus amphitrite]|uniref:Zinc finger protein 2 n=1 Tax=Amphibalanus amphitrite TaxID=1232801 RepID=A0A6A4XB93_AMPAM|nr:Zinc finger protein 2 [Amphibalanus amphitrite]